MNPATTARRTVDDPGRFAEDRLSVCMATCNGARFLEAQIDSILAQLEPGDELLVSDDGSTDASPDILAGYGERIHVVGTSRVGGVVPNFERVLSAARGGLIALSDQDDVWLEGRVALIRERLRHAAMLAMDGVVVDQDLEPTGATVREYAGSRGGFVRTLMANGYVGCCLAFRREIVDLALPFPRGVAAHDWFIALVAELLFDVERTDRRTILFRRHGNNASTTGRRSSNGLWTKLASRVRMLRALAVVACRRVARRQRRASMAP